MLREDLPFSSQSQIFFLLIQIELCTFSQLFMGVALEVLMSVHPKNLSSLGKSKSSVQSNVEQRNYERPTLQRYNVQ